MAKASDVLAKAKSELGTCEPSGDDKFITVYNQIAGAGFAMNVAWCAIFVTWCAYVAGVAKSIIPYFANCDVGKKWFESKGAYKLSKAYGGNYTPKAGDIVFFSGKYTQADSTHVGYVTGVSGNTLYTIEGNTSSAVKERAYTITSGYILGYGLPEYDSNTSGGADTTYNPTDGYKTYTVAKGDSLWSIAQKLLGDGARYKEFMTLNSLTSTMIHPGLVLMIPGTSDSANSSADKGTNSYTVSKGDSLWKIAQKLLGNGARYKEIMTLSNITSTMLSIGQTLTIPAV